MFYDRCLTNAMDHFVYGSGNYKELIHISDEKSNIFEVSVCMRRGLIAIFCIRKGVSIFDEKSGQLIDRFEMDGITCGSFD